MMTFTTPSGPTPLSEANRRIAELELLVNDRQIEHDNEVVALRAHIAELEQKIDDMTAEHDNEIDIFAAMVTADTHELSELCDAIAAAHRAAAAWKRAARKHWAAHSSHWMSRDVKGMQRRAIAGTAQERRKRQRAFTDGIA